MGYEWIQYKGQTVLYVNYSECQNEKEMIALLNEMATLFEQSSGDLLTIDDFTDAQGTKGFMAHANKLGPIFSHNRKKGAVLGIRGFKKVLLNAFNACARDSIVVCDSKQQALDFVTSDDTAPPENTSA